MRPEIECAVNKAFNRRWELINNSDLVNYALSVFARISGRRVNAIVRREIEQVLNDKFEEILNG